MAEEDTCECNAFEKGSAEGKIALDLPLTSSSLSFVSLWKDTEESKTGKVQICKQLTVNNKTR